MHIGRTMQWSPKAGKKKQIYYEGFHCNKNCYVDILHKPLIDAYTGLGLCDSLSEELGRTHSLGNLNVNQSDVCIRRMRENGHIREKHGDLTGGDCQRLLNEKFEIPPEQIPAAGGITSSYSLLRPLLTSGCDAAKTPAVRNSAKKVFAVFHKLYTYFDQSAKLRNTISTWGDQSEEHQALIELFFTCLHEEVNSKLVPNMKAGLTYMTWPAHYLAEHLSNDMAAWSDLTGGIPFGRSSNQVTEHMNKVLKRYLKRHTNHLLSGKNQKNSKFRQVLVRVGALRLLREETGRTKIRVGLPCKHCTNRGIELDEHNMHSRRTSRNCNPQDRIVRRLTEIGRAIGESDSDSQSGSDSPEASESDSGSDLE